MGTKGLGHEKSHARLLAVCAKRCKSYEARGFILVQPDCAMYSLFTIHTLTLDLDSVTRMDQGWGHVSLAQHNLDLGLFEIIYNQLAVTSLRTEFEVTVVRNCTAQHGALHLHKL